MWMRHIRTVPISAAVLLLLSACHSPGFAFSSQGSQDSAWSSERIDRLPPEVRTALTHMCGNATQAAHYFATFLDNSRVIKLHFEYLHCDERARYCKGTSCLRQEYVSTGGHYRLQRSYYGGDN
jgi:hypothetical protein